MSGHGGYPASHAQTEQCLTLQKISPVNLPLRGVLTIFEASLGIFLFPIHLARKKTIPRESS